LYDLVNEEDRVGEEIFDVTPEVTHRGRWLSGFSGG
jgi:hypothetical protein